MSPLSTIFSLDSHFYSWISSPLSYIYDIPLSTQTTVIVIRFDFQSVGVGQMKGEVKSIENWFLYEHLYFYRFSGTTRMDMFVISNWKRRTCKLNTIEIWNFLFFYRNKRAMYFNKFKFVFICCESKRLLFFFVLSRSADVETFKTRFENSFIQINLWKFFLVISKCN